MSDQQKRNRLVIPILVVAVAAMLIAVVLLLQNSGDRPGPRADESDKELVAEQVVEAPSKPETAEVPEEPTESAESEGQQPAPDSEQMDLSFAETRDPGDPLAAGPVDAPVVLVVFSDYQCGYCAKWNEETLPVLMEYADAGDLRIEWRDVNIFGADSQRAASASYAAALQGKYWEYHNELFANGISKKGAELSEDSLVALAGELGLDTEQFRTDLNSEQTFNVVQTNAALGQGLGVSSTPSFLLAQEPLVGAQPTEVFVQALDQKLAEVAG